MCPGAGLISEDLIPPPSLCDLYPVTYSPVPGQIPQHGQILCLCTTRIPLTGANALILPFPSQVAQCTYLSVKPDCLLPGRVSIF